MARLSELVLDVCVEHPINRKSPTIRITDNVFDVRLMTASSNLPFPFSTNDDSLDFYVFNVEEEIGVVGVRRGEPDAGVWCEIEVLHKQTDRRADDDQPTVG